MRKECIQQYRTSGGLFNGTRGPRKTSMCLKTVLEFLI
jgi:hypothetical protein